MARQRDTAGANKVRVAAQAVDGGRAAATPFPKEAAARRADGHPSPASTPFPPIAEYAFISDCEVNALVAPSGRVEWLCLPRPDGRSVFGAMLDRAAGSFRFGPTATIVPAGRRYLPGTPGLETTWRTRTRRVGIPDGLVTRPR